MSKRDDLIAALAHRQPDGAVPVWELEFHLWDQVSRQHLVIGQEYQQLTEREKTRRCITMRKYLSQYLSVAILLH